MLYTYAVRFNIAENLKFFELNKTLLFKAPRFEILKKSTAIHAAHLSTLHIRWGILSTTCTSCIASWYCLCQTFKPRVHDFTGGVRPTFRVC